MRDDLWQYQGRATPVDGGDGPSDPDGASTFRLVTDARPVRRLVAVAAVLAVSAGPLESAAPADTSTDWLPAQTQPAPLVRLVPGASPVTDPAPILALTDGPSDATGAVTFHLVQATEPLRLLRRPHQGGFRGDLDTAAGPGDGDGTASVGLAPIPEPLRLLRRLEPGGWRGDPVLDTTEGPSDADGAFTFALAPVAEPLRTLRRPHPGGWVGDLEIEPSTDTTTEWIVAPPLVQPAVPPRVPSVFGDPVLDASAGPSDPDGAVTFGLAPISEPLRLLRRPHHGGWFADADLDATGISDPAGDFSFGLTPISAPDRELRRPHHGGWAGDPDLDASAGPSDVEGLFTFDLAPPVLVPPRRPVATTVVVADLEPVADTSTEWAPRYPDALVQPTISRPSVFAEPDLAASAGPSDPEGLFTFALFTPIRMLPLPVQGPFRTSGATEDDGSVIVTLPAIVTARVVSRIPINRVTVSRIPINRVTVGG